MHKSTYPLDKVFSRVLNFLSYRPRTEWEIRQYVIKRLQASLATTEAVIKKLHHFNLLNDAQFISDWIKTLSRSKYHGPLRLYSDLVKKGIKPTVIKANLATIPSQTWTEIARKLVLKKQASWRPLSPFRRRYKATQLLISRGFSLETVNHVIDAILPKR